MEGVTFIVPQGHADARAYICFPVAESMATRSSVIETLIDLNGIIELPAGVEVTDLLKWAELQHDDAQNLSAEQLSHALKVNL